MIAKGFIKRVSITKALKCICLVILITHTLWIYITLDFKRSNSLDKRQKLDNYDISQSYSVRANQSRDSRIISLPKNISVRRRYSHFNRPKGGKKDSKDYHLHRRRKLSPMQKILQASGQIFGKSVDDPDFREKHDFRKYETPKYLQNFTNPCFLKNVRSGTYTTVTLKCVPYFMIAGFPKCGTTDLWYKLKQHPGVSWQHNKELNFFNKQQYNVLSIEKAVADYQSSFQSSTEKIKHCILKTNVDYHPCITGDASVDTIFDVRYWRQLPGNEKQTEPVFTNADFVHKINPNMKIIVLLRNPVERLYSDYLYMAIPVGYIPSPDDFHNTVVDRISNFTSCRSRRFLRACAYDVYDDWNVQTYKVRLTLGMYHIFLSDWLKVFPRDNILVLKSEDTRGSRRTSILIQIFKFLGLAIPSRNQIEETYFSQKFMNERNKTIERMFPKTRHLLQDFYKAFNQELEKSFLHIHY